MGPKTMPHALTPPRPTDTCLQTVPPTRGRNPKWLHNPKTRGPRSSNCGLVLGWARPPILRAARAPRQVLPQGTLCTRPGQAGLWGPATPPLDALVPARQMRASGESVYAGQPPRVRVPAGTCPDVRMPRRGIGHCAADAQFCRTSTLRIGERGGGPRGLGNRRATRIRQNRCDSPGATRYFVTYAPATPGAHWEIAVCSAELTLWPLVIMSERADATYAPAGWALCGTQRMGQLMVSVR